MMAPSPAGATALSGRPIRPNQIEPAIAEELRIERTADSQRTSVVVNDGADSDTRTVINDSTVGIGQFNL